MNGTFFGLNASITADYLLSFILVTTILLLGTSRLHTKIKFYTAQSLALVLLLVLTGLVHHSNEALWIAGLTFTGKCLLIPMALRYVLKKVPMRKHVESYLTLPTSMMAGGGLILLSHYLTTHLFLEETHLFNETFSVGVSLVFIGLFIMMIRKKAFTQILGLYVLDNGIFCLTLATVFEMPLVIEIGILFELLLGVMVMGLFVFRIQQSFDTVNIDELEHLKG